MVGRKKLLKQHFEVWKTAASFTPSVRVALFIVSICVLSEVNEEETPTIIRLEQKFLSGPVPVPVPAETKICDPAHP